MMVEENTIWRKSRVPPSGKASIRCTQGEQLKLLLGEEPILDELICPLVEPKLQVLLQLPSETVVVVARTIYDSGSLTEDGVWIYWG